MRKALFLAMGILLTVSLLAACSHAGVESKPKSKTDYAKQMDTSSPEGLAKASSELYRDMVNGAVSPEDGFKTLYALCTQSSQQAMDQSKEQFIDSINQTIDYNNANGDSILRYEYAATVYTDDSNASIERIQIQKSGKRYYFKQEFTKENGVWKIKGDNVTDKFAIK